MRLRSLQAVLLALTVIGMSATHAESTEPDLRLNDQTLRARIDTFLMRDIQNLDTRYSPLRVIQNFELGDASQTVEQALGRVLDGSGYTLCAANAQKPVNATIMASPIPAVHRTMSDVSLLEALKILIGPHHDILIDPITREVGFALNAYGQSLQVPQP